MRTFYRLASDFPPTDRDYVSRFERLQRSGKGIPPAWNEFLVRTSQGLSSFDTEQGARYQWEQTPGSNRYIVRYTIPTADRHLYAKTFGTGHWTLYGGRSTLEQYLDRDYVVALLELRERRPEWMSEMADMGSYSVWDIESNNLVGHYATEREALQVVKELIDLYSPDYADELQLGGRDEAGAVLPVLAGRALVARVIAEDAAAPLVANTVAI